MGTSAAKPSRAAVPVQLRLRRKINSGRYKVTIVVTNRGRARTANTFVNIG